MCNKGHTHEVKAIHVKQKPFICNKGHTREIKEKKVIRVRKGHVHEKGHRCKKKVNSR